HGTPGVAPYMAEVEAGLARAVAAHSGLAREVAGEALSAGGKRLRPLLCFLTATGEPSVAAGVAVEMVHMATLVHDDLVDGACLLGSGGDESLGAYGAALGLAFQIADDILDCAGQTQETGKIPGTDLREGTPTMPLLFAALEDRVVREALAGGPLEGVLLRVA